MTDTSIPGDQQQKLIKAKEGFDAIFDFILDNPKKAQNLLEPCQIIQQFFLESSL